ncbi:MAG: hypothetical protein R3E79_10280 [Caldilineaceae bacterium]
MNRRSTLAQRYADVVAALPPDRQRAADLADLCYTAQCGRNHYPHRLSITAPTATELQAQLTTYAQNAGTPIEAGMAYGYAPKGQKAKVAFLYRPGRSICQHGP